MNPPSLLHVLAFFAIAANVWAIVNVGRSKRRASQLRATYLEEFRKSRVESQDPRYRFVGSCASIIRTDEFGPVQGILSKRANYSLTVYASNEYGEHFVFRASTEDKTGVKYLQPEIARAILKERYASASRVDA
jgi:hypothetical protein